MSARIPEIEELELRWEYVRGYSRCMESYSAAAFGATILSDLAWAVFERGIDQVPEFVAFVVGSTHSEAHSAAVRIVDALAFACRSDSRQLPPEEGETK